MGNSTNRSLQVKYKKSLVQKQALAEAEFSKPCYVSNKPALRTIAASAQHMVVPAKKEIVDHTPRVMVLYNPRIYRKPLPVMWAAMKACDGELVRRADYLRK